MVTWLFFYIPFYIPYLGTYSSFSSFLTCLLILLLLHIYLIYLFLLHISLNLSSTHPIYPFSYFSFSHIHTYLPSPPHKPTPTHLPPYLSTTHTPHTPTQTHPHTPTQTAKIKIKTPIYRSPLNQNFHSSSSIGCHLVVYEHHVYKSNQSTQQ